MEKARKEQIKAIYFDGRKDKTRYKALPKYLSTRMVVRAMLSDLCGLFHPR